MGFEERRARVILGRTWQVNDEEARGAKLPLTTGCAFAKAILGLLESGHLEQKPDGFWITETGKQLAQVQCSSCLEIWNPVALPSYSCNCGRFGPGT